VWDIGANEGYYTRKFAETVGAPGLVVAFEPSPQNIEKLNRQVRGLENVVVEQVAMSDSSGTASFFYSPGGDQTDGLSRRRADMEETIVLTRRADDFASRYPPSVIKIDVEGFEPEVVRGMQDTLRSAGLRAVFIEIHFLTLRQRGLSRAPAEIADAMRAANFDVNWTDSSHICAVRHCQ
jgi:FkbM family methyltransferase